MRKRDVLVITRHPGLVEYLKRDLGLKVSRVVTHVTESDVEGQDIVGLLVHGLELQVIGGEGQDVVGVLPLRLAALANSVTSVDVQVLPELRGKTLDYKTFKSLEPVVTRYRVEAII